MSRTEKIVAAAFFLITLSALQYASRMNYYSSQLDSASLVEAIDTTLSQGAPTTQVGWSFLKALETTIVQSADQVCSQTLLMEHPESIGVFERHANGIFYVLAPFSAITSSLAVAATYHAVSFVGLLFLIYVFLRKEQLAPLAVLLFLVAVLVHPAFSTSAFGQFYIDRFFIFAGFLYVLLLHRRITGKAEHTVELFLTAVLASLISERAAIMIGGVTVVSLILYRDWRGWSRRDLHLLAIAAATFAYALSYMWLVQINPDYGSFSSHASSFLSNISSNEPFRLKLGKFLLFNLPFLAMAALEWRLAVIALGAMLPNMVGSIGGAEKTGWSTHYHSMYFPFLIAAATMGYLRLWQHAKSYSVRGASLLYLTTLIFYATTLNPYTLTPLWDFSWSNFRFSAVSGVQGIVFNSGPWASRRTSSELTRAIAGAVPAGVSVTTTEGMTPALLGQGRTLHYYPLGLASADYAVVGFSRDAKGDLHFSGAVTYQGAENLAALNKCLTSRIWSSGYQLEKAFSHGAATDHGWAVLRRTGK